jgi:hypothetical protein
MIDDLRLKQVLGRANRNNIALNLENSGGLSRRDAEMAGKIV